MSTDCEVIGMFGGAQALRLDVDEKLLVPFMSQGNFDLLKNRNLTLEAVSQDFYDNRYGDNMDSQFVTLQLKTLAIHASIVSSLQAYATANSLTY